MAISAIKAIEHGHEIVRGILCSATTDVPTKVNDEKVKDFGLKLGDWIVDTQAKKSYYISEVKENGDITKQEFAAFAASEAA